MRQLPSAETDAPGALRGERVEVEVGKVAHGGFCVARHEGQVIFVRHALPGERVVVEITEGSVGERFIRGDAVEVLRASPDRVAPPCPYSGPGGCGGCDWQHATPAAQRRLKEAVIAEQLRRLADVDMPIVVEPVTGPYGVPEGLGWRSRVQFAVDGEGRVGLRRNRSHQVVPVERCLIATDAVESVGAERRTWPGIASVEVIAATGSTDRAVVVTPHSGTRIPFVSADVPVSVLRGDGGTSHGAAQRVHGRPHVREVAAGHTWRVTGGGFWQVHPAAPDVLVGAVLDFVRPRAGEVAFDLYCGVGLFAGALAGVVGENGYVVAVESDRQAARDADQNLAGLPQVDVLEGRVDKVLASGPDDYRADVVVLDPPRSGAGRAVVDLIAGLRPRAVGYVACDPAALARDVALFAAHGYRLERLRAFDLFPMTHHVECVALLEPATITTS